MNENVKEVVNENVNEIEDVKTSITVTSDEIPDYVSYVNTIKKAISQGCKRINSVRVKNVNTTEKDNYVMVSFTLANPVDGYISEDNGLTYKKGKTNIIYTSLFAITGAIKEDEDLAWMASKLQENPDALKLILSGATIDILQQEVIAGEECINIFSKNPEPQFYDHDLIINYVISFKLSRVGEKMADKLADKILGY